MIVIVLVIVLVLVIRSESKVLGLRLEFDKIKKKLFFDKSWRGRGHKTYCQKKHSILYDLLLNLAQPRDFVSYCLCPDPFHIAIAVFF